VPLSIVIKFSYRTLFLTPDSGGTPFRKHCFVDSAIWLTLSSEYQSADDQVAVRHDHWTTTCLVPLAIYSGSIFWARQRSESSAARLVRGAVCTLIASHAEYNEEGTQLIFPHFTSFFFHARTGIDQLVYWIPYGRLYGVRFSVEERDFSLLQSVKPDAGVHPAPYSGFNHLHAVFGLRIRGAKPPSTNDLMAWCLIKFHTTLTFISSRFLLQFTPQFNKYFNVGYTFDHLG